MKKKINAAVVDDIAISTRAKISDKTGTWNQIDVRFG
jgi:hypothetical protein